MVIGPVSDSVKQRDGGRMSRVRVLVAAGVVLALGATVFAVQAASSDDGGRNHDRASANSPSADGGTRQRNPDVNGSASPSGKGPGKGKGKGKGDGDAAGPGKSEGDGEGEEAGGTDSAPATGGGGKGGGGAGTGKGSDPVTVSVQPQYWDNPCTPAYLVDKNPGELSPPPGEQDATSWVSANRGVASRNQTVKVTVQGTGKNTVVLESMNVRVVKRAAPLDWTTYKMGYFGYGCGGNVPTHSFNVDLDAAAPRMTPDPDAEPKESGFPYKVSESDPETFFINGTANSSYVDWYLELEWSSGGEHGTIRIDDEKNKPFATSGDKSRPVYAYSPEKKKWLRTNRDNDQVSADSADSAETGEAGE
ncbi:hypothetical protein [Streptomyces sp. NPDC059009]|uniref:hypothetical protein n=1 Tax=Streptomyces sp. NPDC059009 TaxID=3346694 RepID=UPI0036BB23C3